MRGGHSPLDRRSAGRLPRCPQRPTIEPVGGRGGQGILADRDEDGEIMVGSALSMQRRVACGSSQRCKVWQIPSEALRRAGSEHPPRPPTATSVEHNPGSGIVSLRSSNRRDARLMQADRSRRAGHLSPPAVLVGTVLQPSLSSLRPSLGRHSACSWRRLRGDTASQLVRPMGGKRCGGCSQQNWANCREAQIFSELRATTS